jgi:hypothetical protein
MRRFARSVQYVTWITDSEVLCIIPTKRYEEYDNDDLVLKPYIINLEFAKEYVSVGVCVYIVIYSNTMQIQRKIRVDDIIQVLLSFDPDEDAKFHTVHDKHT